nr:unnamed protein product [Callosobruchus chinensis]CAH7740590.1 unnamed protein product [Callosobruchus chinensis]
MLGYALYPKPRTII